MNFHNHTASEQKEIDHSPPVLSTYEGTVQQLAGRPHLRRMGPSALLQRVQRLAARTIFDARFVDNNASFSAYRFHWNGYPQTKPAVAASNRHGKTRVYASWNGATGVHRWRVLAGSSSQVAASGGDGQADKLRDRDPDLIGVVRRCAGANRQEPRARHIVDHSWVICADR